MNIFPNLPYFGGKPDEYIQLFIVSDSSLRRFFRLPKSSRSQIRLMYIPKSGRYTWFTSPKVVVTAPPAGLNSNSTNTNLHFNFFNLIPALWKAAAIQHTLYNQACLHSITYPPSPPSLDSQYSSYQERL